MWMNWECPRKICLIFWIKKSTTDDSKSFGPKTKIPIGELKTELEILLVNLKKDYKINMKKYVLEFTKILDPNRTGMFDFCTLLTLVAEKTEKLETKIKKKKHDKRDLEESQKYSLRPRRELRK